MNYALHGSGNRYRQLQLRQPSWGKPLIWECPSPPSLIHSQSPRRLLPGESLQGGWGSPTSLHSALGGWGERHMQAQGTISGAKNGWAFSFVSGSQIKGQGLPLPTALATSLWKTKICFSVFVILPPLHPKSRVRSKGNTHLNKISFCKLKSGTAECPQLRGWAQTSALRQKQQQSSQRFLHQLHHFCLAFARRVQDAVPAPMSKAVFPRGQEGHHPALTETCLICIGKLGVGY